ncbi:MAG: hypothetical protein GYA33_05875 [Thermogutta sp.]|nr:hypothetical protein [Thermogutta sp.]
MKAVQWLSAILLGSNPPALSDLAAQEASGVDPLGRKIIELLSAAESAEVTRLVLGLEGVHEAATDADDQGDDDPDGGKGT